MSNSGLSDHISTFLCRFLNFFGGLLICVGFVKIALDFPQFSVSDLAMSLFGSFLVGLPCKRIVENFLNHLSRPAGNRQIFVISATICAAIGFVKIFFGGTSFYHNFLDENSLIEWLTALLLIISSYFCFRAFFANTSPCRQWILGLVSLVLFAIGMEELSWGQMIFNWETPAAFSVINSQGETTIHNIYGVNKLIDPGLMIFSGLAIVSSLRSRVGLSDSWFSVQRLMTPSKGLVPMLAMAFIVSASVVFAPNSFSLKVGEVEWAEFLISASIFLHVTQILVRSPGVNID